MYIYSLEHKEFLRREKRKRRMILMGQLFILLSFLVGWEVLARFQLINTFLYSSPSRIIITLFSLFQSGELLLHIGITLWEVLLSFFLSTIVGILIAFFLWKYEIFSKILDPYITILNSLPKVALGPLIIIWVGSSMRSILFMAVTISIFTTIINIYNAFLSVPPHYILLLKSFKASSWQIFQKVIFPSNLEMIIATMKINISLSLIGVIMGELLVSKSGLGYLIMYGSQVFQLDLVISSIFILGIISYGMYFMIDQILLLIQKKRN